MNTVSELQNKLDELKAKRLDIIKANKVNDDYPKIKRTYNYRKQTIIRAQDLALV